MKRVIVRYVLPSLALLALVLVLAGVKGAQIATLIGAGKAMQAAGPPPEAVGSAKVEEQAWEGTLSSVGTVTSAKGVSISAETAGTVTRIRFESGEKVRQGQVLVELESKVERAQLASLEARRKLAAANFERSKSLLRSNAIARAQYDADEAQLKTTATDYDAVRAQIERKTVRAPFAGRLGIREVNLGQYLNPGTEITVLEAVRSMYVDFTLPQQALAEIRVGMPVRIALSQDAESEAATTQRAAARSGDAKTQGSSDEEAATDPQSTAATPPVAPFEVEGKVSAIGPDVDAATRAIRVRAELPSSDGRLRPGMFAKVEVVLPHKDSVPIAPATAVMHAPYGDSVFIIEDKKPGTPGAAKDMKGRTVKVARQQFVRVGETRGDFVSLLAGVRPGQELVTSGAFKLRNGAPVVLDNRIGPEAKLDPHPQNR